MKRQWRLAFLVIAFVVWVIAVEMRLSTGLGLHRDTTQFLADHDEMFGNHTRAIGELQRIHIYELEEVLEEVRRWEEFYDRPAGESKPTESKALK